MTLAQQCANAFKAQVVTTSVNKIALELGGEQFKDGTKIRWEFFDGSSLVVTGRGKAHRMVVLDK